MTTISSVHSLLDRQFHALLERQVHRSPGAIHAVSLARLGVAERQQAARRRMVKALERLELDRLSDSLPKGSIWARYFGRVLPRISSAGSQRWSAVARPLVAASAMAVPAGLLMLEYQRRRIETTPGRGGSFARPPGQLLPLGGPSAAVRMPYPSPGC